MERTEFEEVRAEVLDGIPVRASDVLTDCADALAEAGGVVRFGIDKSGRPRIAGAARMHAANQYYKEQLASYDYDGSDEERKRNAKFLAAVRSYRNKVRSSARAYKVSMFESFDADLKTLVSDADEIIAIADERKKRSKREFEDGRRRMLEEFMEGVAVMDPVLEGLSAEGFIDPSWLNRSTSERQAREAMDARLHVFSDMVALEMMPGVPDRDKVSLLRESGWDVTQAMRIYLEREKARLDAEAAAAKHDRGGLWAAEERSGRTVVHVSVPAEDVDRLREALASSGIDWREV